MTLYVIRDKSSKRGAMFYVRHFGVKANWASSPINARKFLNAGEAAEVLAELRSRMLLDDCEVVPFGSD